MTNLRDWTRYYGTLNLPARDTRRVVAVTVRLVAENAAGAVAMTDVQLQRGGQATGWVLPTASRFEPETDGGGQVRRHYNAVVRGDQVLAVPNRAWSTDDPLLGARVSGPLDVLVQAASDVPAGGVSVAYRGGSRAWRLQESLGNGQVADHAASERRSTVEAHSTEYGGPWQTLPAPVGEYDVSVDGAAHVLLSTEPRYQGPGGDRP